MNNNQLLEKLANAQTDEERYWIVTESLLATLSPELAAATWAAVVPHWFNAEILAALRPELQAQSSQLYKELQALPFVEEFADRGHNIHDLTRNLMLKHLWQEHRDEFITLSQRAAEYFCSTNEQPETQIEWLYHLIIFDREWKGSEFRHLAQNWNSTFRIAELESLIAVLLVQISAERVTIPAKAEVYFWAGKAKFRVSQPDTALKLYKEALAFYRDIGDHLGEANTLQAIGDVLQFLDRRNEALKLYQEALAFYCNIGDHLGEANTLQAIGILQQDLLLIDDGEIDDLLELQTDEDDAESGKAVKLLRRIQSKKKHYVLDDIYRPDLEMINPPEIEEELLLIEDEEDLLLTDDGEIDDFLEPGKAAKLRRRTQSKKKHYTEDSIRLYLEEIGRIRLLRADEEIELARQIAKLLELERARERLCERLERDPRDSEWAAEVSLPLLTFRHRLHMGRRAKDKIVQSNLRLVVSIAQKYQNRGLSFQDLIQEGSLGVIRAAEKFDHEKGYKFSTYATWCIRQAITRAIADQSRTIRLPLHLYETISRINKTTKLLSQEMGRKPTEEEIATRMEISIEKLRFIAKSAQLPISLETPIGKEEDACLVDFIESDEETPEDQVSKNLLREDLEKVLDSLSPRERDVLRLRYGLDDGRMKTLEEIGQIFNVTRERIRQIEAKALRKLRHLNRNSVLKDYIR